MSEVRLIVYGNPVAKQRARHRRRGAFMQSYTPEETVEGEASIREVAQQMLRAGMAKKLEGAIEAELVFYRAVQNKCSRKDRALKLAGILRPVGAPDWDNLGKLACDALNGVLYGDDCQITDVLVRKRYCVTPRTEIVLREVGAGQRSFIVDESAVCSQEFRGALTCGGRRTAR
jgi:Holliday junction resolvase RusA-like endonuclease